MIELRNNIYLDIGIERITWMNGITTEQLESILKDVLKITRKEWNARKENIEKFAAIQIPFELPDNRRTHNIYV